MCIGAAFHQVPQSAHMRLTYDDRYARLEGKKIAEERGLHGCVVAAIIIMTLTKAGSKGIETDWGVMKCRTF
jgi:hypothetical protein